MIRFDLCYYSDAYIVVKGTITVLNPNTAKKNKSVPFKNNAPFINCISKIKGVKIDSAEDQDVVMPMYNLLEYSKNYKKTTASLWIFHRYEPSSLLSSNSQSFKYKTSITGNTYNVAKKITDGDGNEVDNPEYDATKLVKMKLKLLFL